MRLSINKMSRVASIWKILLTLVALSFLATACTRETENPFSVKQTEKVKIVTTIFPIYYFAARIGGELAEVVNLIAAGVEAHDFEPTPADIRVLDTSDLVIYNGSGFEPWIDRALDAIGTKGPTAVEASLESVELTSVANGSGETDPHVWLDPLRAIEQVKLIRDGLTRANPAGAETYSDNAASLVRELEKLHQRYLSGLLDCRQSVFVTSHEAFGYLAQRYKLEQVAISGISQHADPSPGTLAKLVDMTQALGVRYVTVEANVEPRIAETLANEVGAELLPLHTLESLTPDEQGRGETYFSLMETNLINLRTALECWG